MTVRLLLCLRDFLAGFVTGWVDAYDKDDAC